MGITKEKIKEIIKKVLRFLFNPRLLLCLAIAWIITNGWSYIFLIVGTFFGINWMLVVGAAYLSFLWIPLTPEKLITVAIAIFLLKRLFPNDTKTLAVLQDMQKKIKEKIAEVKAKRAEKKAQRRQAKAEKTGEKTNNA